MSELKPCPFCGVGADYFYLESPGFQEPISPVKTPDKKYVTIRCRSCFCGTGFYRDKQRAEESWNSRTHNG